MYRKLISIIIISVLNKSSTIFQHDIKHYYYKVVMLQVTTYTEIIPSSLVVGFATILLLNVAPLIVQGQVELFQLSSVNEPNLCLKIQQERGTFVPCQTETVGLSENTVFLVDKNEHLNYKIELFTSGKCLDYNYTTSNLCLSRCDKRELINWK